MGWPEIGPPLQVARGRTRLAHSDSGTAPERRRFRVYVAGPYTHGDVDANVAAAMAAADALIRAGFSPYVPHLWHFQHVAHPQPYAVWTAVDLVWLEGCQALLRLPGYSPGADMEVVAASKMGIPVFDSLEDVVSWVRSVHHTD